ncbi:MAG TPA: helix-hairpin-helix domain-containing protein, partial [Caulobacter sp.]|nr:helix-hairpin-helix domain-containing protein [Caulobacter sp.]
ESASPVADDLTRLTGIGPKLAASLAERGVTRFADIAAWTAEDVAKLDSDMKLMGRIDREAWVAQAKRFAEVH